MLGRPRRNGIRQVGSLELGPSTHGGGMDHARVVDGVMLITGLVEDPVHVVGHERDLRLEILGGTQTPANDDRRAGGDAADAQTVASLVPKRSGRKVQWRARSSGR